MFGCVLTPILMNIDHVINYNDPNFSFKLQMLRNRNPSVFGDPTGPSSSGGKQPNNGGNNSKTDPKPNKDESLPIPGNKDNPSGNDILGDSFENMDEDDPTKTPSSTTAEERPPKSTFNPDDIYEQVNPGTLPQSPQPEKPSGQQPPSPKIPSVVRRPADQTTPTQQPAAPKQPPPKLPSNPTSKTPVLNPDEIFVPVNTPDSSTSVKPPTPERPAASRSPLQRSASMPPQTSTNVPGTPKPSAETRAPQSQTSPPKQLPKPPQTPSRRTKPIIIEDEDDKDATIIPIQDSTLAKRPPKSTAVDPRKQLQQPSQSRLESQPANASPKTPLRLRPSKKV